MTVELSISVPILEMAEVSDERDSKLSLESVLDADDNLSGSVSFTLFRRRLWFVVDPSSAMSWMRSFLIARDAALRFMLLLRSLEGVSIVVSL